MFYNNDEFRRDMNFDYGEGIDININNTNTNQNVNMNENYNENFNDNTTFVGDMNAPIIEQGRERIVQRNIVHEVRHICPINTRIINNHIYKHTYQPRYTCCEENVVTNEQCGSCCNFR